MTEIPKEQDFAHLEIGILDSFGIWGLRFGI